MSEEIFRDLMSIEGIGEAKIDGQEVAVSFTGKLQPNGNFDGSLRFPATWAKEFMIATHPGGRQEVLMFQIDGKVALAGKEVPFSMRRCVFTRANSSFGEGKETILAANYRAIEVVFDEPNLDYKPVKDIMLLYELANVTQTFRVIVETPLGRLSLGHAEQMKELEAFMQSYGSPMITSQARLEVKSDGTKKLGDVIEEATKIVDTFLKITTLAQGSWHSWVMVTALEQTDEAETYRTLYRKIRHPKMKNPSGRDITVVAHSPNFISSAWRGYSDEVNSKYGFDLALEWYVEACGDAVVESKLLNGTTCLELLIDRYSGASGTLFLLQEDGFSSLKGAVEASIEEWASQNQVDFTTLQALKNKVRDLNRRSFASKTKLLLEHWKLRTDDLSVRIGDIIAIRDEITHTGGVRSRKYEGKLIPAYYSLMEILVRLFLAMLRYDDQYYSYMRAGWVKFSDVSGQGADVSAEFRPDVQ